MSDVNGEWLSVNETAKLINVSARAIYLRIKKSGLASHEVRGVTCVRPMDAFRNFNEKGRRPAGLKIPFGYEPQELQTSATETDAASGIAPLIQKAIETAKAGNVDLHEVVAGLVVNGAPESIIRAASQAANAIQKKRADAVRAGKSLAPEDVVKMLRDHGELIVEETEASALRAATGIMKLLRDVFGVDLGARRPDAQKQLESFYLAEAQHMIKVVRHRVEDQVHGVQALEFQPAEGGGA